jgi:hypothetical protein
MGDKNEPSKAQVHFFPGMGHAGDHFCILA